MKNIKIILYNYDFFLKKLVFFYTEKTSFVYKLNLVSTSLISSEVLKRHLDNKP